MQYTLLCCVFSTEAVVASVEKWDMSNGIWNWINKELTHKDRELPMREISE